MNSFALHVIWIQLCNAYQYGTTVQAYKLCNVKIFHKWPFLTTGIFKFCPLSLKGMEGAYWCDPKVKKKKKKKKRKKKK